MEIKPLLGQIVMNTWFERATLRVDPPGTCDHCPFRFPTREPEREIRNDPSEAHYQCGVLNKEVWGEYPACHDELTEMVLHHIRKQVQDDPDPKSTLVSG